MRIFPLGENALTVEFSNKISFSANDKVVRLNEYFEKSKFDGFLETVPAYSSLTVFYDLLRVRRCFPDFSTAFAAVSFLVNEGLKKIDFSPLPNKNPVEIPVNFNREFAPDLPFVAEHNNLKIEEVIEIFVGKIYRVFMLGFLPGFSYMGEIDKRIAAPRKQTPRLNVSQKSVGIAGRQTGIYPLDSPGGWQIIGRANVELFTPDSEKPVFLSVGDSVKFIAVTK